MFEKISVMRVASQMSMHATARQRIISQNIANSNTPNYEARDIESFSASLSSERLYAGMRATRAGHIYSSGRNSVVTNVIDGGSMSKPNGNTVSIEQEILKSIEVERQHSKALAVYQHSIDLLKMSIGRGR